MIHITQNVSAEKKKQFDMVLAKKHFCNVTMLMMVRFENQLRQQSNSYRMTRIRRKLELNLIRTQRRQSQSAKKMESPQAEIYQVQHTYTVTQPWLLEVTEQEIPGVIKSVDGGAADS